MVFSAAEYCDHLEQKSTHGREAAILVLARKAVKRDLHILPDTTKNEVPPCRLKSHQP